MRQLELQAGDCLVADGCWNCFIEGMECLVHGSGKDKFIYCETGLHLLSDYEDECGDIIGFARAVNGKKMRNPL